MKEHQPLQEPDECEDLSASNEDSEVDCPEPLLLEVIVRRQAVDHSDRHDNCVENVD